MSDLISVIVPVYNCEKYVGRCIESIINQTYKNLEIILVNDGSVDNSLSILKDYKNKDSRIIVIDKKNEGVSTARNAGLQICKGRYITFVDADDWIDNIMYEEMHKILVKQKVDLVRVNYFKNRSDEEVMFEGPKSEYADRKIEKEKIISEIIPNVLNDKIQALCTTFMYSSQFKTVFSSEIFLGEDKLLLLELLLNMESIYLSNKPYYHYFYNSKSANFNNIDYRKNMSNFICLYNKIESFLKERGLYSNENKVKLDNFISKWVITNSWIIYKQKDGNKAYCKELYSFIINNNKLINIFQSSNIKNITFFDNKIYMNVKKMKINKIIFWCKLRYILVKLKGFVRGGNK